MLWSLRYAENTHQLQLYSIRWQWPCPANVNTLPSQHVLPRTFKDFSAEGITNDSFVGAGAWVASSQLQGEKLPDVITSPAVLEHVDNLEEVQFTLCGCCRDPTIKHLGDVYAILLFNMNFSFAWTSRVANRFLKLAHSAWPMFSPFWTQQLRVRSLKSCAISAKGLSFDSAMFLNSYARACESGSIPAEELADQILLGFPLPKSFAQIVLMCALQISLILSLCLILLAFWYSKLVFAKFAGDGRADRKASIKVNTIHFVVFVIWGIFIGFGNFLASMVRTTSSLMQRLNQMRTLNKMLSGASGLLGVGSHTSKWTNLTISWCGWK